MYLIVYRKFSLGSLSYAFFESTKAIYLFIYLFIHLFICDLFNDLASNLDYVESKNRTIIECWLGKDMEGYGNNWS
jgi:hypothetical protein